MARGTGFLGALFNELRYAVQDIRQKVVEQGWFGQVTSAKPVIEMHTTTEPGPKSEDLYGQDLRSPLERRPSFEEQWQTREPGQQPESGKDREQDRGIEL